MSEAFAVDRALLAADRALLAELAAIESSLRVAGAPEGELLRLSAIQGQLLRRWVSV